MKKTKTLFVVVLVSIIGFFGCEKYIDFEAEITTPKLVLNSWFSTDTALFVHLSHSLSVIDNGSLNDVADATVRLLDANGNELEVLIHGVDGYYYSTTIPTAGSTYNIEASAPTYTTVTATNSVPSAVAITALDTVREFDSDGFSTIRISVSLNDPSGDNFYQLRMRYVDTLFGGNISTEYAYFWSEDPTFENVGTDNSSDYGLFRDLVFNNQSHTVSFLIDAWYFDNNRDLEVVLINTTKEGYNYRLSFERYNDADGNPFAQPVQVLSNVENGFGLFAGYSDDVWVIDL